MNNNFIKVLVFLNTILVLGFGLYYITTINNKDIIIKTVDDQVLFSKFKMSQDIKKIGMQKMQEQQKEIDVLHQELQQKEINEDKKNQLLQQLISKRKELDQFNQNYALEEGQKIWERMASYSKMYAQEHQCEIIISKSNSQNVLFASESSDITNQLLFYINKKYEGN